MADVVFFHHIQGLTDGVRELAERLRAGGRHTVHTPDLYAGVLAGSIDEGMAVQRDIGRDVVEQRASEAVEPLGDRLVYAGISMGAGVAQQYAQQRPGAVGALLYEGFVSLSAEWSFGTWPDGLPVQVHGMENDPFFGLEGDVDAARELVSMVGEDTAELYVYPGDQHLFVDSSLPSYDASATDLVIERSLALLDRVR